jgi:hypothetical protein
MSNPNPVCKFERKHNVPLAKENVTVRLPVEIDSFVRSLPNRTEWLRRVITEAAEREVEAQKYEH